MFGTVEVDDFVLQKIGMHLGMIGDVVSKYKLKDYEKFTDSHIACSSIGMNILIIGKLVKQLEEKTRKRHNHIAWDYLTVLANTVVNNLDALEMEAIWKFVEKDREPLKKQFDKIMDDKMEELWS